MWAISALVASRIVSAGVERSSSIDFFLTWTHYITTKNGLLFFAWQQQNGNPCITSTSEQQQGIDDGLTVFHRFYQLTSELCQTPPEKSDEDRKEQKRTCKFLIHKAWSFKYGKSQRSYML